MICGTLGLILTEDLHPFDAFCFVIVTIATVGFGDISPHTIAGKKPRSSSGRYRVFYCGCGNDC
ncbi:potassium channel family protein [Methanoregula sp.]|uniref:potassium channel family protein n=1 Tax=Methanoregula sp. TaxID=2052170 RepID=UPI002375B09F|nr:potassium channel family protein [Methanoregula sp.]MDD1685688.1 potassium channel family protein [Methanoregula sp.]